MGVNLSPLRLADEPSQWTKCSNNNFEHWGIRCIAIPFREHDLVQRTLAEEEPSDAKVNIGPRLRWCSCSYDSAHGRRTRRADSALLRPGSRPDDSTNGCSRKRSGSFPSIIDPFCQTLLLFQVEVKHSLLVLSSPRTDRSGTSCSLLRKSSWRPYLMDRENCNVPRRNIFPQSSPHSLQRNRFTLGHI